MKQILFIFMAVVLVGCGTTSWTSDPDNPQNVSIEQAIRKNLKKPEGKLTSEDLAKVSFIDLRGHREITDVGLKEVAKLENLTYLHLYQSLVTDKGLKEISTLRNLFHLGLTSTRITDAGLKEMAKLKNLGETHLSNNQITKAGVSELQKALPKLKIYVGAAKRP